MSGEVVGLLEPVLAPPIRVLFYSFYPVGVEYDPQLAAHGNGIEVEVAARLIGSDFDHPSIIEAIELAVENHATMILLPNDAALGSLSYAGLIEDILPKVNKHSLRIRAVPPGSFDTADPKFMAGIQWSVDSVDRHRASRTRKKYGPCVCHHRVGKPGSKGHNLLGGEITVCYAPHCGCPEYRPADRRLMGK